MQTKTMKDNDKSKYLSNTCNMQRHIIGEKKLTSA